jgi:hypothetical protein
MKNNASLIEERQFITKEFADTLAGKTPPPHFRLHDPLQNALVKFAASDQIQKHTPMLAYCDRMIHFWRKVSLAGLARSGRGLDDK